MTHNPPGAQKEKVKERSAAAPRRSVAAKTARPYAEMRAASAFSFLDSAVLPEDLMSIAAERDLPAMALVDTNGVYGAPRFYGAAQKTGVQARVGAELVMEANDRLTVLVENRTGYKNLCRLLTAGALAHPKGEARYSWKLIEEHAAGLRCLTRADEATVHRISGIFKGRTHVELQRHFRRDEEHQNVRLVRPTSSGAFAQSFEARTTGMLTDPCKMPNPPPDCEPDASVIVRFKKGHDEGSADVDKKRGLVQIAFSARVTSYADGLARAKPIEALRGPASEIEDATITTWGDATSHVTLDVRENKPKGTLSAIENYSPGEEMTNVKAWNNRQNASSKLVRLDRYKCTTFKERSVLMNCCNYKLADDVGTGSCVRT